MTSRLSASVTYFSAARTRYTMRCTVACGLASLASCDGAFHDRALDPN